VFGNVSALPYYPQKRKSSYGENVTEGVMGRLDGKRALVCGVANKKSIAWGIAEAFHSQGALLAFTCLENNVRRVRKLAAQLNSDIVIPCNVGSDSEIEEAMTQIKAAFDGRLHVLLHSIAYANLEDIGGEFINVSRSGWKLALDISAYSLVALARCARPMMKATGGGSIMTLSFEGGEMVVPGYNIMGVAKAALNISVRYLAYDLGPENIRVNAIAPGPVSTFSSQMVEDFDTALRLNRERSPLMRNVSLQDIGNTAIYLASDWSQSVTGAVIKVDNGMNIMCPPTIPRKGFTDRR
jgi:enoyl-[acyl-carrier protein] reductase I